MPSHTQQDSSGQQFLSACLLTLESHDVVSTNGTRLLRVSQKWSPAGRKVGSGVSLSVEQPGHDRSSQVSVVKPSFPQLNNFSVTLCSQTAELSGSSANHSPCLASFSTTVGRSGFGWTSPLFEALRSGRSCVNKQCVSSNVGPRWGSDHPRWEPQRATCPAHMSVRASHCCEARAALHPPLTTDAQLTAARHSRTNEGRTGPALTLPPCHSPSG